MIAEYGKVIILAIVIGSIVMFMLGKGQAGFTEILKKARPVESVGHQSAFEAAKAIAGRTPPKLSVSVKKLKRHEAYNLLDEKMFEVKAVNEDGEKVKVSVVKMIAPDGTEITESVNPQHFIPDRQGGYYITYKAKESYIGSIKTTEKTYCFIAD